ncbi:MAG TPA: protein translocase subunit SecD [Solirubrobacterales bacterium]|nr:protein translocase subunit SecD [Solirubrobacterales bacterium]
MIGRRRYLFILLFVVGLIAASVWVILEKPTRLGLDLRGGVELVYQGRPTPQQPEVTSEAVDRSIEIIRDRIDSLGVAEPEVSRLGTQELIVSLPDVDNAERAISQVGRTSQLYFYDWEPNVITKPDTPGGQPGGSANTPFDDLYEAVNVASRQDPSCADCTVGPRWYMFTDDEEHELIAGPGQDLRKDILTDENGDPRPRDAGELIKVPQGTLVLEGSPESDPSCLTEECYWVIQDDPALSGTDIENPTQNFDPQSNQPNVAFEFTDEGRDAFQKVTRAIAQRGQDQAIGPVDVNTASQLSGHFAVVLDGEVVSRPIINFVENPDGIDGRTGAQISGDFTVTEAQDLATILQIGALPINLELISQSQVSATLGQQALDEGIRAGALGLFLVVLFLLFFYRFLGAIAAAALLGYGAIFFALINLIPITMTLPGIAGLILTVGVAADSNIVIFERIKEEVRAGRAIPSAISVGYRRGISTIIDANVVTLLTAFILFVLATAGVKGFAFMLGIGTLVSLLTAVVFTQALLGSMSGAAFLRRPSMLGAGRQRFRWHFNFTGMSRWFFSISGLILIIGSFSFAVKGVNLGIDFESGTRITVALAEDTDEAGVREAINEVGVQDNGIQRVSDEQLGDNVFQFRSTEMQPEQSAQLERIFDQRYGIVEGAFNEDTIGPTFGAQVARSAVLAVIFSLLLVTGYVALRFQPKFAIPVLIAIVHDILITGGIYSLMGREMTSATVAALLTIQGYSLYDTMIVFDRIRENLPRMPRAAFSQIVNRSMNEIIVRSMATSISTLTAVMAIFIFGGDTLKDFALAMAIGIASGTYSSLFIAAPVLAAWKEREPAFIRRREVIAEKVGYVPAFEEDVDLDMLEDRAPAPSRADQPEIGSGEGDAADSGTVGSGARGEEGGTGSPRQPAGETETERQRKARLESGAGATGATTEDAIGAGGDSSRGDEDQPAGVNETASKRRKRERRRRKHGRNR